MNSVFDKLTSNKNNEAKKYRAYKPVLNSKNPICFFINLENGDPVSIPYHLLNPLLIDRNGNEESITISAGHLFLVLKGHNLADLVRKLSLHQVEEIFIYHQSEPIEDNQTVINRVEIADFKPT